MFRVFDAVGIWGLNSRGKELGREEILKICITVF